MSLNAANSILTIMPATFLLIMNDIISFIMILLIIITIIVMVDDSDINITKSLQVLALSKYCNVIWGCGPKFF